LELVDTFNQFLHSHLIKSRPQTDTSHTYRCAHSIETGRLTAKDMLHTLQTPT
jgi:hypothetical protein